MLSLLLSALVLAWGTVLPEVQHAHEGGSDPTHGHDGCQEMAHLALHDQESDDEHHEHSVVPDVSLLADFVAHLHVRWLGIELSLPVSEGPSDGDDSGDTFPPTIVRTTDEVLPVTQAGLSFDRMLLTVICTPSVDVVADLKPLPPPQLAAVIPLCDSARLERTGVLLA